MGRCVNKFMPRKVSTCYISTFSHFFYMGIGLMSTDIDNVLHIYEKKYIDNVLGRVEEKRKDSLKP